MLGLDSGHCKELQASLSPSSFQEPRSTPGIPGGASRCRCLDGHLRHVLLEGPRLSRGLRALSAVAARFRGSGEDGAGDGQQPQARKLAACEPEHKRSHFALLPCEPLPAPFHQKHTRAATPSESRHRPVP